MEYAFQVQILYLVVVALALTQTQQSYRYSRVIKSLLLFFVNMSIIPSIDFFLFIYLFIINFFFLVHAMNELIKQRQLYF